MSKNLKIVIVEDELLIAEMLKETLVDLNCEVVAIARNFKTLVITLDQNPGVELIFLDINLNEELTGLDIAHKLNKDYRIPFVFLTSYSDNRTIQEAIAYKPQSYLIKPFTKSEVLVTLELFKSKNFTNEMQIEIKDGHFILKIKHNDILWVKAENNYIEVKTIEKLYVIRNSLSKFFADLADDNFIKTHRSYIVNLNHVKAVNKVHIIVHSEKLPISRVYHDELLKRFLE